MPIAFEPPPMQAKIESGSRPFGGSCIWRLVSSPMMHWKSRTIAG